jgi:hypothetical protein
LAVKSTKDNGLPFVIVEWDDAWKDSVGDGTVQTAHEDHKPILCRTVGWVIRQDEEGIQIANEHSPKSDNYRGRTFIPKAMIKDVIIVKLTKAKAKKAQPQSHTLPETVPETS